MFYIIFLLTNEYNSFKIANNSIVYCNTNHIWIYIVLSYTASSGGSFTVRLQHQPDVKTATSGSNDGDTDFALTFALNIQ